jgi:hypothetical protein
MKQNKAPKMRQNLNIYLKNALLFIFSANALVSRINLNILFDNASLAFFSVTALISGLI